MNFIIYASTFGFYDVAYHDVMSLPNVSYFRRIEPQNIFLRKLYRIHLSRTANRYFSLPLKYIWIKTFIPQLSDGGNNTCFLFFSRWMDDEIFRLYLEKLKTIYPKAKYVCYFHDIFQSHRVDADYLEKHFDLILTYDKNDSKKYNFEYYPTPYSYIEIQEDKEYESDVFFLGKAKNRLNTIIEIYDQLEAKGLDCRFLIVDTPQSNQITRKGIRYIKGLPYKENLKYVRNAKCLLEIMQDGAQGITPRTWEAIMYNKQLITNNQYLENSLFYLKPLMTILNADYDLSHYTVNARVEQFNTQDLIKILSPTNLLKHIESLLW